MGKIVEVSQSNFSGGMSNDLRIRDFTKYSLAKNFDAFTFPHKLVPYHKLEEQYHGVNDYATYEIKKFLYAPCATGFGGGYALFGLGVKAGETKAKIYRLNITADQDSAEWQACGNGEASNNTKSDDVFFYYKTFLYYFRTSYLCRFDTTEAAGLAETYQNLTWTDVCQPVHCKSDDCAYFFCNNIGSVGPRIYRLNNTSWDGLVLTLPDTDSKITCACEYGNYLALGCVSGVGANIRSYVYLWDRDSSIATLTERIDFGEGSLTHLANLNNKLIGVMNFYANSSLSLDKPKILIKQASGQFAVTLNEIILDDTTGTPLPKTNYVRNNVLYFPMWAKLNGDNREGIWAINEYGRATLEVEDSLVSGINGIYATGNIWWIACYVSPAYFIYHTDDDATYSATNASVLETMIINGGYSGSSFYGDSATYKKLLGVTVMTEPMPAAGKIILKYRKDEDLDSTWTTIFTNTTDDSIFQSAINISGATLPEYKELQLRIESYGGAVVTGWKEKSEVLDKDIY